MNTIIIHLHIRTLRHRGVYLPKVIHFLSLGSSESTVWGKELCAKILLDNAKPRTQELGKRDWDWERENQYKVALLSWLALTIKCKCLGFSGHLLRGFTLNASQDCLYIEEEGGGELFTGYVSHWSNVFPTFISGWGKHRIPWHCRSFHKQECTRGGHCRGETLSRVDLLPPEAIWIPRVDCYSSNG